jgi:hypothetical protein
MTDKNQTRAQFIIIDIFEQLRTDEEDYEAVRLHFLEEAAKNPAEAIGWRAFDVIVAQTACEISRTIRERIERVLDADEAELAELLGEATDVSTPLHRIYAVLDDVKAKLTRDLMRGEFFPNSTSPAHNLKTLAQAKAKAAYIERTSSGLNFWMAHIEYHWRKVAEAQETT